jgi:hypothetical protein
LSGSQIMTDPAAGQPKAQPKTKAGNRPDRQRTNGLNNR